MLGVWTAPHAVSGRILLSLGPRWVRRDGSNPSRLRSAQTLPFNAIRLSPQPREPKPLRRASQAWAAAGSLPSGTFRIVLAEWHSTVPASFSTTNKRPFLGGLVWVIEGKNVPVRSLGMGGGTHLENAIWPVNASTRQLGGELTY
jgi:hypothetical protein